MTNRGLDTSFFYIQAPRGHVVAGNLIGISMNIFFLDPDPAECVKQYCDSHVIKMTLETTQLLCTSHHACGSTFPGIYKPSHMNHPSSRWVRNRDQHYAWAWRLLKALHQEFEYRRGKEHASKPLLYALFQMPGVTLWPAAYFEPDPIFVGPEDCLPGRPVIPRYRELYRRKRETFKRPMCWTKREVPEWL